MRRHTLWISLIVLGAAALVALRAPAVAPPPANLDQAIASQRALAAERPGDAQILNDLGNLLLLTGAMEEAEQAYRHALEIEPEMASARYNLALLLGQTGRPRRALQQLEAVVDLDPENAWAQYQIGAILDGLGADGRAVRRYALAFRLDPQLAFEDVNPHVIENEHLTEAMLIAYRDMPLAAQAPKTYEQPARIVDLLVPSPAAAAPADAFAEGQAAPAEPRSQATYAPGAAAVEDDASGENGNREGGRVLRERDLERGGSVNQIVVPGYQQQPRGGTRVPPVRTYTPPGRAQPDDGRTPDVAPGQPGSRPRFVPGIPSTGRLEIELLPVDDGDRETLAAAG